MSDDWFAEDVKVVVIIGASGFIGAHLLKAFAERKDIQVHILTHSNITKKHDNFCFVEGDLLVPESLDSLLSKDCTVINLAYLQQNNLDAMTNLAIACVKNQVKRLIHCSTAVVAGRTSGVLVTENTVCTPISEYERTKLEMESILLEAAMGKFEITILRPTAVFGPGGRNLIKLAGELLTGNPLINYFRSSLYKRRNMNLVCVENVVAALIFLLEFDKVDREVFIISDDDSSFNNYRDIESRMLSAYGNYYLFPRLLVPDFFLIVMLRILGRSNSNPSTKYSNLKLTEWGFKKAQNLEIALDNFIAWHKDIYITNERDLS